MGGISRHAPRGVGRGLGAAGAGRCAAEIPQAPARPEEAEAQEAERGEDQTRRHREDPQSSSSRDEMTTPKGWVLGGYSPPLIEPGRLTVPALLAGHGYATACVGKWHLGMTWP